MDSKQIEHLLEKYWNCETSLEEEQALRAYFNTHEAPAALNETADLFRFFELEKGKSVSKDFDRKVTDQIRGRRAGKIIGMTPAVSVARIAAGIVVVAAAIFFIRQEVREAYPEEVALVDTYDDPKVAFEETKKALMMISRSFGKAKSEAGRIRMFNEAEKKIQNRSQAEEKKSEVTI